jgi:hypothetical protein
VGKGKRADIYLEVRKRDLSLRHQTLKLINTSTQKIEELTV